MVACAMSSRLALLSFLFALWSMVLEDRIDLRAEKKDQTGNIEPQHEDDHGTEAAIRRVVLGEALDVDPNPDRGRQ